jgi:hypothetical protein
MQNMLHSVGGKKGAEYISNVVFPSNQFEWYCEKTYDPRVPIYRRSYDAAIFFQSLELYYSPSWIHNWVSGQTYSLTFPAERARLSTLGGFNDLSLTFMEGDASDHIFDSDGVDYVPEKLINPPTFFGLSPNPQSTLQIAVKPFTSNVSTFGLAGGQDVDLYFESDNPGVRMVYHVLGDM